VAEQLTPEQRTLKRLIDSHENELKALRLFDRYYEGTQPLSYMHPDLQRELEDRLRQVVVNWPRLVIDSVEERLDVEGFRYPDVDDADDELQRVWQANNLDEWSQQGHVDAMVMRRTFTVVSHNDDDPETPLVSVETPLEMHAELDPATRQLTDAVKRWQQPAEEAGGKPVDMATLYTKGGLRIPFRKTDGTWEHDGDPVDTNFKRSPVSLLPNRPRLRIPMGTSDLVDITPLSDAACKIATDMMVAAEFAAIGQRWVFGMNPEDFKDPQTGQTLSTWQAILGRVWSHPNTDAKAGTFPPADLKNFHDTLNALARMVASIAGLPVTEMGFITDNPPSADAIRASEIRRIKRAERKQRPFGGGWENTMRLVRLAQLGQEDVPARRLETIWRDPSTPTVAQKADAATKLFVAGVTPLRQTREDLGYSVTQIERMEQQDREEDPMQRLGRTPPPNEPPAPPAEPPAA
jgi:hypothetical protein